MRILLTGASGFLGKEILKQAVSRNYSIYAMSRKPCANHIENNPNVKHIFFDLSDYKPEKIRGVLKDVEFIINCAAVTKEGASDESLCWRVNFENTRRLYQEASAIGLKHWVQISTMSAHEGSTSIYGRTKLALDEYLRNNVTMTNWTILRPSLIYGNGRDGLVGRTLRLMEKLPFIPIIGNGKSLIRPVHVSDVSRIALDCLDNTITNKRTYTIGGLNEVTLNDFFEALTEYLPHKKKLIHLPIPLCLAIAKFLALFLKYPPLTIDNVLGIVELQRVDINDAIKELSFSPISLREGLNLIENVL